MNTEQVLGIVNAVAVVVLVMLTGYYAVQTRSTVREMSKARESTIFPKLLLEVTTVGAGYPIVAAGVNMTP